MLHYTYKANDTEHNATVRTIAKEYKAAANALKQAYCAAALEDKTPADTVANTVAAVGYDMAVAIVATLTAAKSWDGRISKINSTWAETVPGCLDEDTAQRFWVSSDLIHPAQLDQIAHAARRFVPPTEEPEAQEEPAAEPAQEDAQQPQETQEAPEKETVKKWVVDYVVGNTYKVKYIKAKTAQEAIKKAKVKNIVDLQEAVTPGAVSEKAPEKAQKSRASGYYTEKILAKFTDAIKAAKAELDAGRLDTVHFSAQNEKMGAVHSVSLVPFLSCPGICASTCGRYCYAAKLANLRPNVLKNYAENMVLALYRPADYWQQIRDHVRGCRFFRFHVAGDIINKAYFAAMARTAQEAPHCQFLAFTKRFDAVNAWLADHDALPENLHILFSGEENLKPENPHSLPETTIYEKAQSRRKTGCCVAGTVSNAAAVAWAAGRCSAARSWRLKSTETATADTWPVDHGGPVPTVRTVARGCAAQNAQRAARYRRDDASRQQPAASTFTSPPDGPETAGSTETRDYTKKRPGRQETAQTRATEAHPRRVSCQTGRKPAAAGRGPAERHSSAQSRRRPTAQRRDASRTGSATAAGSASPDASQVLR